MKRIRAHLSPGVVIGIIALIVALAGTSVALPGKKSIDKNDFRKKSVTTRALAGGAVTSGKLADGAVVSDKLGDINTRSSSATVTNNYSELTANCQEDEQVISGGAKIDNPNVAVFSPYLFESHKQGNGWYARAYVAGTFTFTVEAYCLG
jgi:hypothetical protein